MNHDLGPCAQEVSVPLSGSTQTPGSMGRPPGSSPFEAALDGAQPLTARLRSTPRTYSEVGDLSPRQQGPLMGAMWQEIEEVTCPLISLSSQSRVSRLTTFTQATRPMVHLCLFLVLDCSVPCQSGNITRRFEKVCWQSWLGLKRSYASFGRHLRVAGCCSEGHLCE